MKKLKYNQIIDGRYIGYHQDKNKLPIKKGDIVLIKKGTRYHTMLDGSYRRAGKSYKVKVDHIINGAQWIEHDADGDEEVVKNPEVSWSGSGGYWHRADINDVLEQNPFISEKEMTL